MRISDWSSDVCSSDLAEEFIIWASQPFGFVRLPDALSTGSSIMPQKKNPDAAELVRGHAGRIIGCAAALMVTMKGLPLAYSKDMQDDKPPVFEAASLLALSIAAMTGMVADSNFNTVRMRQAAELGYRSEEHTSELQSLMRLSYAVF